MASGSGEGNGERHTGMLVVFWGYLLVIAAGLIYFTVIGLTHH